MPSSTPQMTLLEAGGDFTVREQLDSYTFDDFVNGTFDTNLVAEGDVAWGGPVDPLSSREYGHGRGQSPRAPRPSNCFAIRTGSLSKAPSTPGSTIQVCRRPVPFIGTMVCLCGAAWNTSRVWPLRKGEGTETAIR